MQQKFCNAIRFVFQQLFLTHKLPLIYLQPIIAFTLIIFIIFLTQNAGATLSDSVGVKWSALKPRLNSNYDWDSAVERSLGDNVKLEEAIAAGSIFVVQFPLFDNLATVPDITELRPSRNMWPSFSPIALFVSRPGDNGAPAQLKPVAIQLDFKPGMVTV